MTPLEKRFVMNWATVIMGKVAKIEDVPHKIIKMNDGSESTMREQVEIEIAKRELGI